MDAAMNNVDNVTEVFTKVVAIPADNQNERKISITFDKFEELLLFPE
jgi:hypothetical protein